MPCFASDIVSHCMRFDFIYILRFCIRIVCISIDCMRYITWDVTWLNRLIASDCTADRFKTMEKSHTGVYDYNMIMRNIHISYISPAFWGQISVSVMSQWFCTWCIHRTIEFGASQAESGSGSRSNSGWSATENPEDEALAWSIFGGDLISLSFFERKIHHSKTSSQFHHFITVSWVFTKTQGLQPSPAFSVAFPWFFHGFPGRTSRSPRAPRRRAPRPTSRAARAAPCAPRCAPWRRRSAVGRAAGARRPRNPGINEWD